MGEVIYRPLIDDMTWSYSRIEAFDSCPYKWFMRYIKNLKEDERFYASYGTFMHKLIEEYYKGIISKEEMVTRFLLNFSKEVKGNRPQENTVLKYIRSGVDYLNGFSPFPFEMIDVEKRVSFDIDGIPFVGVIDYVGKLGDEYVIVDNKSRDLKPRSKRKNPTQKDIELDTMLRQLYIYSTAIKKEYGRFPKLLCFNCFKSNTFIKEPFNIDAYNEAIEWAKSEIEYIKDTEDFYPRLDFFACNYLCGFEDCCYKEHGKERRVY